MNRTRVLTGTISGGVTINGTILHYAQDDLPFGGVGASGVGAYHGIEGFRAFSHQKAVFDMGRWNGGALLRPPFGRVSDTILSWMLRPGRSSSQPPVVVHNEIVIPAGVERVWDLLTDVARWPSWYRACMPSARSQSALRLTGRALSSSATKPRWALCRGWAVTSLRRG